MIDSYILGYPQPPQERPEGEGGEFNPILSKIMCYINSGVFISRVFKNDLNFHFVVLPTPARTPPGGGQEAQRGVESHTTKNHVLYQFLGFQQWRIQNYLHFHFRCPPSPARALPEGEGQGAQRGLSPIPPKIMCFIDSGVSIVVNSKIIFIFIGCIGLNPLQAPSSPGGALAGVAGYPKMKMNIILKSLILKTPESI